MRYRKKSTKTEIAKYGYQFKSGLELLIADQLQEAGVKWEYETVGIDYLDTKRNSVCNDCGSSDVSIKRTYWPDFILEKKAGGFMYLEGKGKWDQAGRSKMTKIKKSTDIDVRMVFESDNWLNSNHKTRYSDFAAQKGMPWSIKVIPPRWLEEVVKG